MATKTVNTAQETNTPSVNPFIALTAKKSATITKALTTQFDKAVNKEVTLATDALAHFDAEVSETATSLYSLIIATNTGDSLSAASGAALAAQVQTMIESYYAGNKDALAPAVEASHLWVSLKTDGEVKTENLPNSIRLLVGRRSSQHARDNELDTKLTLSCDGKKGAKTIVIKESPLKAAPQKTQAQKVFDQITKLDALSIDELTRLFATDGRLSAAFSSLAEISTAKAEKMTQSAVAELVQRRDAASTKESELDDVLAAALEKKSQLVDDVADIEDRLAENETALTNERLALEKAVKAGTAAKKADTKEKHAETAAIAQERIDELLLVNSEIEAELGKARKALAKAQLAVEAADTQYTAQAQLCANIGQKLAKAEAVLH